MKLKLDWAFPSKSRKSHLAIPQCDKSKLICELIGVDALTPNQCSILKELDYTFEVSSSNSKKYERTFSIDGVRWQDMLGRKWTS
jgi:hypothetical protein|tara:strand:+ start:384 stop:638 length:255 start_codon:yes stop_codon:yes gene_type:complete